tara:strand:+ start:290 stop:499 length:210 start_codon:yes stop_codon:yes gene_type:complete
MNTPETTKHIRDQISHCLDAVEMLGFNDGFEAATNALDEYSEIKHKQNNDHAADILRWAAMELRGDNVD